MSNEALLHELKRQLMAVRMQLDALELQVSNALSAEPEPDPVDWDDSFEETALWDEGTDVTLLR